MIEHRVFRVYAWVVRTVGVVIIDGVARPSPFEFAFYSKEEAEKFESDMQRVRNFFISMSVRDEEPNICIPVCSEFVPEDTPVHGQSKWGIIYWVKSFPADAKFYSWEAGWVDRDDFINELEEQQ